MSTAPRTNAPLVTGQEGGTVRAVAALRLRGVVPGQDENTRRAGKVLLDVLRRIDELALVSFRVASRDGRLYAGLVVESFDDESAVTAAERLRTAVDALAPWLAFETGAVGADDPLLLPQQPAWASRVLKGELADEMVRAGDYSPLAAAMAATPAVLSVAVARSGQPGGGLVSDIIIASDAGATDVLAALLTAELSAESNIDIETGHGVEAAEIVASHHRPRQPIHLATFADVFSLPVRADTAVDWLRYPARPQPPEAVLEVLGSANYLHRWVLGRTGMGKTTLLEHLALADIAAGKPVVVIDPHGGLVDSLMESIPNEHLDRVKYADFGADDPPLFNPLIGEPGQDASSVTNEFVETVRSLWDDMPGDYFGPIYDRTIRFCTETLVRYGATPTNDGPAPTIANLANLLRGDTELVSALAQAAAAAGDTTVAEVFEREINNLGAGVKDGANTSVSMWALSKLQGFVSDERIRRIVHTGHSTHNLTEVLDGRQVLLVRVPVGVLGLAGVRAISQLVVARLVSTLGRRFEDRDAPTDPVALYVDEWALVAEPPIQRILAEGRKYGFELTIANQSLQQVKAPSKVAGNVGTLALFRVGPAESALFAAEFETITASGLRLLPPYHLAIRPPFADELVGEAPTPAGA